MVSNNCNKLYKKSQLICLKTVVISYTTRNSQMILVLQDPCYERHSPANERKVERFDSLVALARCRPREALAFDELLNCGPGRAGRSGWCGSAPRSVVTAVTRKLFRGSMLFLKLKVYLVPITIMTWCRNKAQYHAGVARGGHTCIRKSDSTFASAHPKRGSRRDRVSRQFSNRFIHCLESFDPKKFS